MSTTTIRVDRETHARLLEISRATGAPLVEVIRDATEALERRRFARRVTEELDELRRDPRAWSDYVAEAAATDVGDGLDR